ALLSGGLLFGAGECAGSARPPFGRTASRRPPISSPRPRGSVTFTSPPCAQAGRRPQGVGTAADLHSASVRPVRPCATANKWSAHEVQAPGRAVVRDPRDRRVLAQPAAAVTREGADGRRRARQD